MDGKYFGRLALSGLIFAGVVVIAGTNEGTKALSQSILALAVLAFLVYWAADLLFKTTQSTSAYWLRQIANAIFVPSVAVTTAPVGASLVPGWLGPLLGLFFGALVATVLLDIVIKAARTDRVHPASLANA